MKRREIVVSQEIRGDRSSPGRRPPRSGCGAPVGEDEPLDERLESFS